MRFLDEDDARRLVWERCESPIEQLLCTSLFVDLGMSAIPIDAELRHFVSDRAKAFLFSQHRIERYRADFLVIVADRQTHVPIVIECDGKRYHSSDEQIAYDEQRDLALLAAGARGVWRFTGSEIVKRTDAVLAWISDRLIELGVEPTRGVGCEYYRAFRNYLTPPPPRRLTAAERIAAGERQRTDDEIAEILRADAAWM